MNLIIIEAPGKAKWLSQLFWRAGLTDNDVVATRGHICENPGLQTLGIAPDYTETNYALKPDRLSLSNEIRVKAAEAKMVYLATDDDHEGDVIARDVLKQCVDESDRGKVLRLRLKSLSPHEIAQAVAQATPFDELLAARGDARRIIDRVIGSLSDDSAVVGRVQGSTLLMLRDQVPVVGEITYTLKSEDGQGVWIAKVPVYAGQDVHADTFALDITIAADPKASAYSAIETSALNFNEILLFASMESDLSPSEVAQTVQDLYESGKLTYPRAKDRKISQESAQRLEILAQRNGASFQIKRFISSGGLRDQVGGAHAHEAPNAATIDVPVNRDLDHLSTEERVLVHISRRLINCGIECRIDVPSQAELSKIPPEIANLRWHRIVPIGTTLWGKPPVEAGFKELTKEQAMLNFMIGNSLGRPSTIANHLEKFLGRGLVDDKFEFTLKGQTWCHRIAEVFKNQNISTMIENYLDISLKSSSEMVAEMVEMCQLKGDIDTSINSHLDVGVREDAAADQIPSW